jgi:general stress protein 26
MILFNLLICLDSLLAQQKLMPIAERDTIITAARELIAEARYCALITLDASGHPHARAMEPFPPEDDMTIWFGTTRHSRKIQEIRNDARVTLYYADCLGNGYLTIKGSAQIIDDPEEKTKRWNENWETFYPEREKDYILIKVTPKQLDLLSMKDGITGDEKTWRIPSVDF